MRLDWALSNEGDDVEDSTSVVRRGIGRSLLLTAVLATALTGAAACGNGNDTATTNAAQAAPAETATPSAEAGTSAPLAAESPTPTAAPDGPIVVTSPVAGATVSRTFTVTGTARTVEGTVLWKLVTGNGDTAATGMTDGGAEAPAPFKFTVTAPAAGEYTLRVFEESAKDGGAINAVERTLTVE